MSPILQALSNFEQREQLYAEAGLLNAGANALEANASVVEGAVEAGAPQVVATAITAIEKADANVPEAVFINELLTAGESEIDAELQPLIAQGGALIPSVVTAMRARATTLQAKASTL